MRRISGIDLWIWVCVAAGLLALRLYPAFAPALGHDSFQYLSAADNALAGRIGYTSLIHYDVERAFGVLPAPMLTFPSGYPLAIAFVSLVGVSTKTAALILSGASAVGCIPLLLWLGLQLGFSRGICHVVVGCFVLNGIVNEYSSAALSESLFMFLALSGIAALVAARLRNGGALRYWLLAGFAFGAAYFVRYAGLFFIVGLALVTARHLATRERLLVTGHAIALAVASAFVMAGVARNMLLVGNWHGRDEMVVNNPLPWVLSQTVLAINGLFLGIGTGRSAPGGTFAPKAAFVALLVMGIALLAWSRWRQRRIVIQPPSPVLHIGTDLLLLSATYVACMIYAGHASSIAYGVARHFLVLVPLILLLFGLLLRFLLPNVERGVTGHRIPLAALAISFCCYAYLNVLVIRKPLEDQEALVAEQFNSRPSGMATSRAAVLTLVGPQGAILANNGQAVGYFLRRPTISTVGPVFSNIVWDEQTVRDTIQRFHVTAVVITAPAPGRPENSDIPSPFIGQLAQGSAPAWLKLADRSATLLTYVPVSSDPQ